MLAVTKHVAEKKKFNKKRSRYERLLVWCLFVDFIENKNWIYADFGTLLFSLLAQRLDKNSDLKSFFRHTTNNI